MKSTAPWSVKGIERDARETAKEAARREGMTVGEWLNHMIYTAGDGESSGGNVEGLKAADLVTAIEHLSKRLAEAESKSAIAVEEMTRNFGGVVERVQRLERIKPAAGGAPLPDDLEERLERLESRGGDRQRIEALKALEKAVGQIALQFDSTQKSTQARLASTEQELQQLASRLDLVGDGPDGDTSAVAYLKDAIDGLSSRITRAERIASEAARIRDEAGSAGADTEFVERTGERLRILGDEIKRSGDQIRTLEGAIKKLSNQIDAAERRSSEGVQKVAETIAELRTQFDQADTQDDAGQRAELEAAMHEVAHRADERFAELKQSLDDVMHRLEAGAAAPVELTRMHAPAASLAEDIEDEIEDALSDGDAFADFDDETAEVETAGDADEEEEYEARPFGRKAVEAAPADHGDLDAEEPEEGDAFAFDDEESERGGDPASILSEVESPFAGTAPQREAQDDPAPDTHPEDEDTEGGIDAILAELDGLTGAGQSDESGDDSAETGAAMLASNRAPAISRPAPPPAIDEPAKPREKQSTADFLKAARQAAKEAAQKSADNEGESAAPQKRQLTPKQRAILAAKIRRKRLAEQGLQLEGDEAAKAAAAPSAKPAARMAEAPVAGDTDDDEEPKSIFAKAAGALGGLRAKLPGAKKNTEDGDDDRQDGKAQPAADAAIGEDGNPDISRTARSALKRVGVKPLTLALGAAIVLAAAALFFLVKDLLLGGSGADTAQQTPPVAAAPQEVETVSSPQLKDATVPAAPDAPLTQPRTLYLESVAKLKSASSDAETRAALQQLREAAALGHPPAQLQLGELYKLGQGVDQDLAQARLWYERAATGGNVLAMHRIGVMSARGQGGDTDEAAAINWFTRASNLGLVDSQYNLGAIYHPAGDGSAAAGKDAGEAYFWYSLAAKNGDDQAGSLAAGLAGSLSEDQREAIDARVADWTAETPDPDANEIAPAS